MNDIAEPTDVKWVTIRAGDPNPGRVDRSRMGKHNPLDTEPRPPIPQEDIDATRAELAELRRRRTPKSA